MIVDIFQEAIRNPFYRRVISTGDRTQVVVMTIHDQIGEEVHCTVEQSIFVVEGDGTAFLNGRRQPVFAGDMILIKPGVRHNLIAGAKPLRLITIYSPPNHIDGRVHRTRADAESDSEDQDFGHQIDRRLSRRRR